MSEESIDTLLRELSATPPPKRKRYLVDIRTYNPMAPTWIELYRPPVHEIFRWKWRARLACWLINNTPPHLGMFQRAKWREITT